MKSICIIGASRGIGLGLAKEMAQRDWHVVASQRSEGDGLSQAASSNQSKIEIITCDVTDPTSFAKLKSKFKAGPLDCLLVNAGIMGPSHHSASQATREEVADIMMANTIGPARLAEELLPCIRDGGTLAFTTSQLGSIQDSGGGIDLYRICKASQNMLARGLFARFARDRGIPVLSLHPGHVATEMGGSHAPVSVEESAKGLADVLETRHSVAHHFLDYRGQTLPW